MSIKQIEICDGCGCELKQTFNKYKIHFNTGYFTDGAGSRDYNFLAFDFCPICAKNIKETLEKIAKRI